MIKKELLTVVNYTDIKNKTVCKCLRELYLNEDHQFSSYNSFTVEDLSSKEYDGVSILEKLRTINNYFLKQDFKIGDYFLIFGINNQK